VTACAPSILWLRQDLRLSDNPALTAAAQRKRPILPLYVLDDETPAEWRIGGASRWWLHHSLASLDASLGTIGLPLILRRGPAPAVIAELSKETGADAVFWNRTYEPYAIARDIALKQSLTARGVAVASFNAALLREPWTIKTKQGEPYKVFTPFWQALRQEPPPAPLPLPGQLSAPVVLPRSADLSEWSLLPTHPDWSQGLHESWTPGEVGAQQRLAAFLDEGLVRYRSNRDLPDRPATARLSPHLHWGEISPRQIWHAVHMHTQRDRRAPTDDAAEAFLRQLGWREFTHHLLYHWPDLPSRSWRSKFDVFPWRSDPMALRAWQKGMTGYPIVDAGMRELWRTGWMHNRVRMIAASFLVKDLLVPWQTGEAWFWDTLVDADLAQNAFSWQWVAGSGADAAPYFRIFNPVLQGQKFDPDGRYVRRWVPELARLPNDFLHQPWLASPAVLASAGVVLGRDYPLPMVQHAAARDRALAAFKSLPVAEDRLRFAAAAAAVEPPP
jgi:deoxyribodipyrimidine photo-lyase